MRSMDGYIYGERDGGEGYWCCVEEGGSSLVCASALALVGVCVSSTGVTPPFSLLSLSLSPLSLSEEDDYERQPGMNWSLVLSLLIATSIKSLRERERN